jgi:hypothetical protein
MRHALALPALLVLLALATACGGRSAADTLAGAATKSQNAGGVHVSLDIRFTIAGRASGAVTGAGAFDQNEGDLTIDMSNLLQLLNVPTGSGGGIREIFLHEGGVPVLYMQIPFLAGQLPPGKTWVRLDLAQAAGALGLDLSRLLGQSGSNPVQTLDLLRAARGIQKVGPDIVDGFAVTQYHATIDLKRALKLEGVPQTTARSMVASGAAAQFPVDVWIGNQDGLVHQFRMTQSAQASGQTVTTLTTMRLTRWGSRIAEHAPPKARVFDATQIVGQNKKA